LLVEVVKKSSTALSSNEGEFDTSTCAPDSTSASPSPVEGVDARFGDAAIASWPCSASLATTLEPMSPVPPITTTFVMMDLPCVLFIGKGLMLGDVSGCN